MAKSVKKKGAKEASDTFHKIMGVSVGRVNPLNPNVRKLYIVKFDKNNNPIEAKLAPLDSGKGHGFGSWDKKTFFTIFVYVEAFNTKEALALAKEIAEKRLERGR